MKANIFPILFAHWNTLYHVNDAAKKISLLDIVFFYGLPIIFAGVVYFCENSLDKDAYNVSVTFFGIFVALLLNIQVAIFSIHQRKWNSDGYKDENKSELRKLVLKELNINISYLMIFSCISLSFFLTVCILKLYNFNDINLINSSVSVFLYSHFILTFIMIVKRSHALFHMEYLN